MFKGRSNSEEMQTAYRYTGQIEQKLLGYFGGLLRELNQQQDLVQCPGSCQPE